MTPRQKTDISGSRHLGDVFFHFVPLLVLAALWIPFFMGYRVPGVTVSDEMIRQARESPSDAVLDQLRDFRFLEVDWKNKEDFIAGATNLLQGNLRTEGCSTRVSIPFSERDFTGVAPGCDLMFAGFLVPDVWLRAYELTGRKEFFTAAERFILDAQAYEQSTWRARGSLWNDHAVAARIPVLANFWRLYRHSSEFQPDVARRVLQMVGRSEELLTKPGQFTFATNHGIMQNLALMHASLAFPSLPRTGEYQQLARARLADQMKFFVSNEGIVLEHSAGYHLFGVELLGMAFRYLDLMQQPAPPEWIQKYQRAEKFYATLRRPDGSLPALGDTGDETAPLGPLVTTIDPDGRAQKLAYLPEWKPADAVSLYPVSGYAVWWDGLEFWPNAANLSQTVVAWSNFPSQSHKHADEMSVLFWAGGQTWLSNIGYWPYEDKERNTIESWAGSDAPHLVGESSTAPRTTKLLSTGSSGSLTAIELERTGTHNYVARRQVIHYKPNLWMVIDNTSGPETSRTTTTWTSAPDVIWQQGKTAGSYTLKSPQVIDGMNMFVLGSPGAEQKLLRGSSTPFAGWQVKYSKPVPAFSLLLEQPVKNSWAAAVWTWGEKGSAEKSEPPQMTQWTDASHWQMQLPAEAGNVSLRREDNTLQLHSSRGDAELKLAAAPDVSAAYAEIRNEFVASAARYPVFSPNPERRKKVTLLLFGIFLLQEIIFALYKRFRGPGLNTLQWLNVVAWILGTVWLVNFFL